MWTAEEHERFLLALAVFGRKNWPAVTALVGSRTDVQVRSHAQKYFKKVKEVRVRPRVARLGEWSRIRTPLPPRALAMRSKDWTNQLQLQLQPLRESPSAGLERARARELDIMGRRGTRLPGLPGV